MADDGIDPSEQTPEADLLEQQAPLQPEPLTVTATLAPLPETPVDAVDEADRVEQHTPVLGEDDDCYPHEATGPRWS